ncbi:MULTISPECIES: carbon-nitrogen hydrolase family protein [Streptomyces]|uniref:Carbon-nitrogen hydrolase family protein n=1 Tax=Streptomyces evansiae TaxID=3075535 RepID=A0ABU2R9Z9_9ACTN|nr:MULTISPECIES: carbon-nitrogen hydrolase family protein [unclassified Streptomyces]MDT0413133.1 carbon-nitrogen hydrolase family protein [Streptomyces sp. DSM 41979]MYQ61216.1 carbon-nitrogen hydrolase family protein [Streptomyces sp. SID4926]SCE44141.1 D-alanyl-D-alanine dipeptidase [Streptomyces sp. DfronAA-171]
MRIAAAQLTRVPADVPANARRLAALAAPAGAALVVFPELALTGYETEALRHREELWVRADDPRLAPVRASGVATVVNCATVTEDGRPAIGTLVFGRDGELITTYRKQHLFAHESDVFVAGAEDGAFELDGVRFASATCFDNHFPALVARGAASGCQVHLASALHGTGGGGELTTLYPRLAEEHALYVVVADHVGPAGPWTGCRRSAAHAPGGALPAEADAASPMIVTADIG